MADKQYYVKVNFEYGVDNGDGSFTPKNTGDVNWVSMPYENAVGLQNYAVIPCMNDMFVKAGELGLIASGFVMPDSDGSTAPGSGNRPKT